MAVTSYAFQERRRGRGYRVGQTICVRAISKADARKVATASMGRPVYHGGCTGRETVAAVSDAARAEARKSLYPDMPELWASRRRRRKR